MVTQEKCGILDHDVYVNTKEMKYCADRHDQPICLVEKQYKPAADEYIPSECHEVHCRKCRATFMAATTKCLDKNSCNEKDCEYCGHYREECAAEELMSDIISRERNWYEEPNHDSRKTSYHMIRDYRKGNTKLYLAECTPSGS